MTTVTTATLELGIDIGRLSGRFRSTRHGRYLRSCSAWDAPAGGSFPPKCGSSSGRTSRRCGPCCPPPFHGSYCRALRWCSCIWKNAGWSRPGWTDCRSVSCTIKQCPHWLPAASCPTGAGRPGAAAALLPQDHAGGLPGAAPASHRHRPHSADGAGRSDRGTGGGAGHQLLQVLRRVSGK